MTLGFYFNMKRCAGCRACQVACQDRNDMPVGKALRKVDSYSAGTFPKAMVFHYSGACNHCENPACVTACPTGACQKADDGTVFRDAERCIGCGMCALTCPYGHPVLLEDEGVSAKCDACRAFRDEGLNPVCVDACQYRALEFGELDELRARHAESELVSELPLLPREDITGPSLLVNPKDCALGEDYREWVV